MNRQQLERYLADIAADINRLTTGRRADGTQGSTLLAVLTALDEWGGLGYPSGGGEPTRGTTEPLPQRLAVAGAHDPHNADLLEAEVTVRHVAEGLRWLVNCTARNHVAGQCEDPRRRPATPTATCLGCGRTIADTAIDPVLSGRCTSSKDRPNGGCHADWLDERREKDRVRQAEHRARRRGLEVAEECEGVTGG